MDVSASSHTDQTAAAGATSARGLSRVHLIVLLAMLGVVAALAWTTWSARALMLTFVPQVNALMQTRVAVTEAHLWLEEIVSGDAGEEPRQVRELIGEARWHLQAMRQGGERGLQVVLPVEDGKLRDDIARAMSLLAAFEQLAFRRIDAARAAEAADAGAPSLSAVLPASDAEADAAGDMASAPAGATPPGDAGGDAQAPAAAGFAAGSDLDQRFDEAFAEYIAATLRIEDDLNAVKSAALTRFLRTQLTLMAAIVLLFAWILWMLWRKEASDRDAHVRTLQASLARLSQSQRELERQNALRGAVVDITAALQGLESDDAMARALLAAVSERCGVAAGIVWSCRAGAGLARLAARALTAERLDQHHLAEGEGLAGRAAQSQQLIALDVPQDYFPVGSALGSAPAPHLLVVPLLHDRATVAVMELAFLQPPGDFVRELLDTVAPALAVRLHTATLRSQGAPA